MFAQMFILNGRFGCPPLLLLLPTAVEKTASKTKVVFSLFPSLQASTLTMNLSFYVNHFCIKAFETSLSKDLNKLLR